MCKRILVLGSTGSIGRAALDVAAALGAAVEIVGLVAGGNWRLLREQAERFRVPRVALSEPAAADSLRRESLNGTQVLAGDDGLAELVAESGADLAISAIGGAAGLPGTLAAVERGMDVGLANKESLVVAGSLIMPLARERGSRIIPIDSEHSAVFQALHSGRTEEIEKIYLTASGGPFRTWSRERIAEATLDEALQHPTWEMGAKITIDSATMMNKALEVIEATHLFGVPTDRIEVVVHPESIIHSMVEFCDGSVIAQLGTPDMKTPIQYAITFPRRAKGIAEPLRWGEVRALSFEMPDLMRFPALRLGFEAARRGGTAGAVLNAANEAAVALFRERRIRFGRIAELTERAFDRHRCIARPTLAQLREADAWAREEVFACS